MNEAEGFFGWVLAGVAAIISALSGAVTWFYKTQITDYKLNEAELKQEVAELRKMADVCEADRSNMRVELAVVKERIAALEKTSKDRTRGS